jgi:hypothetical protein
MRHGQWSPDGELVSGTAIRVDASSARAPGIWAPPTVEVVPLIDSGRTFEVHARQVLSGLWAFRFVRPFSNLCRE